MSTPRIAIISSLNFPGGTATAMAEEISLLTGIGEVAFYNADVKMLRKNPINHTLFQALRSNGVSIRKASGIVSADIVLVHNPSLFKFEDEINFRILAKKVFVIMHENPINAFSSANFRYDKVLNMLHKATISPDFIVAPISGVSRNLIVESGIEFKLAEQDWFNIWSEKSTDPCKAPQDRRGRHSRPGIEKWPSLGDLRKCFPEHAENHILGATPLMQKTNFGGATTHLYDFGSLLVEDFLKKIDFYVYFHSSAWHESFGRCIAEAISAGKMVITHDYIEQSFGKACVYCKPDEIEDVISYYIDNPKKYVSKIKAAQRLLRKRNGPQAFVESWGDVLVAA